MTITEFLKTRVPFLAGLSEEQAHVLAEACEQKPFALGQTVLFQGVSVDGLHIVAQGKVSVTVKDPKAKEPRKVADLGPGDVFGERSILEFTMAGATIKSQSKDTLIFILPEKRFVEILEKDEGLKMRTLKLIAERSEQEAPPKKAPPKKETTD